MRRYLLCIVFFCTLSTFAQKSDNNRFSMIGDISYGLVTYDVEKGRSWELSRGINFDLGVRAFIIGDLYSELAVGIKNLKCATEAKQKNDDSRILNFWYFTVPIHVGYKINDYFGVFGGVRTDIPLYSSATLNDIDLNADLDAPTIALLELGIDAINKKYRGIRFTYSHSFAKSQKYNMFSLGFNI